MVVLEVARHYGMHKFEYNSVKEAASEAIVWLDNDKIWPVSITENGQEVWIQDGPFGDCIDKLRQLASAVS